MKKLLSLVMTVCIAFSMIVTFDMTSSAATVKSTSISSISNVPSGIKLKWKKVSNAKKYIVLKKSSKAKSYKAVKTIKSSKSVTYTDKKVTSGSKYSYKITAVSGNKKITSKVRSVIRLTAPIKLTAKCFYDNILNSEVKLSWKKTKGAKKYEIYRKLNKGKFKKIKTISKLKYNDDFIDLDIDTDINGKTATYKVRAINGKSTGVFSAKKSCTIAEPPLMWVANPIRSGMNVTWVSLSSNITSIDIYKAVGSTGSYKKLATVSGKKTSYIDKNVKEGTIYKYYIVFKYGKVSSQKSENCVVKYGPLATISVGVGGSTDQLNNLLFSGQENNTVIPSQMYDLIKSMIKVSVEDENIATVSSDLTITGVSEGKTNATIYISVGEKVSELAYITINVN